jgi:uncharacterized protein with von Willebrand factor type A (vWA) domain
MFVEFFFELKKAGIPTTIREYLVLMEAMDKNVAGRSIEEFYYLARCALVKDERYFDRFDLVFEHVFKGAEAAMIEALGADVPEAWLRAAAKRVFSEEDLAKLEAMGLDALLKALAERMAEQRGPRHARHFALRPRRQAPDGDPHRRRGRGRDRSEGLAAA